MLALRLRRQLHPTKGIIFNNLSVFKMSSLLLLYGLCCLFHSAVSYDPCTSQTTCGACIRVPNCVWCSKTTPPNQNEPIRCQSRNMMKDCPSDLLVDPIPQYRVLVDNANYQLRPQEASLINLRLGQMYNVSLKFTVAKDYPLDLYYLMDVSNSMYGDKNNLVRLAGSLASTMRNLTSNFKLGFGSFVDKNVLPFVEKTGSTCGSVEIGCSVTYSFKNQLPLSEDENAFIQKVNSTAIVVSYDTPEGGFDALAQAITCKDQIGWSSQSRRLIVFATDANSHLAGNGKLGGILKPNDGQCHVDSRTQYYTEAEKQDYPSLGQISRLVSDNAINLIFAVTPDIEPTYVEFMKFIPGASVGQLGYDSENIVQLINDIYKQISSTVQLKDKAGRNVKLRYFTSCASSMVQESNKCEGLQPGTTVEFIISIEIIECPLNPATWVQPLFIYPIGINEAFRLRLEMICDCPCERPGNPGYIPNAEDCNYGGQLECGICHCDASHSGQHCECSGDSNPAELESKCKADNSSSILCSDRGECVCGTCECQKRPDPTEVISGKYCECDNFSCDRVNGLLCSGNGECTCHQCVCYSGWTGDACDCKTSNSTCMPIGGGDICSGNGICNCGTCQCSSIAQGKYCENCPTCPSQCDEFQPCVECKVFQTGPFMANNQEQCEKQCTYSITVQSSVQVETPSERDCSYKDDKNCIVKFVYGYDDYGYRRVRVQQDPICPQPVPILAISFGILGGLLLLGLLLLLLYKLSTHFYDKKQYARFLEDQKKAKWSREGNPLYVEPSTTFRNPKYGI